MLFGVKNSWVSDLLYWQITFHARISTRML